jgi:hypothetical protein
MVGFMAETWQIFAVDTQKEMCYSDIVQKWAKNQHRFQNEAKSFGDGFFIAQKLGHRRKHMTKTSICASRVRADILSSSNAYFAIPEEGNQSNAARILRIIYWSAVGMAAAFIISLQPVFATTIWDAFSTIMKDIYGRLLGVSTIIGVTAATIALLVRMISRNQRAVDEASAWLKRIIITWLILNTLGFIVAYIQPLIAGGQYTA